MAIIKYLKSAVLSKDFPDENVPEVLMLGRSNAGKSSLINAMAGGQKVAKVSKVPGKTISANFFSVGEVYRIVDLPGYGFAARPQDLRALWQKMILELVKNRPTVAGAVLICDIRRKWTVDEEQILNLCESSDVGLVLVLNKVDKLNQKELNAQLKQWVKDSGLDRDSICEVSCLKNKGILELEQKIYKNWVKQSEG